jgi:hypothetical protein
MWEHSNSPAQSSQLATAFRWVCRSGTTALATRRATALVLILSLTGFGGVESLFAPGKRLWQYWTANDAASMARIDHGGWNAFLQKYLVIGEVNRVRYASVTQADRRALDGYVGALAALRISKYNRAEQFAYWVNLYNALTVAVVLDHYPVSSIRKIDISPGLFAVGPWDAELVTIESQPITLNDIEHRILRPIWNDPRLHYALNCAALSCPSLQPTAFTSENANWLMEQAARDYINGRGVQMSGDRLIVSSIYAWYTEDFGGSEAGVLAHLRHYAAPPLAAKLARYQTIAGDSYDWSLNDAGR